MSKRPIRIQGGVFLWICALCSSVVSFLTIRNHYDGFGAFLLVAVGSVLIGVVVCKIWRHNIARVGNSPEDERGPLIALSISGACIFAQAMYAGGTSPCLFRIMVSLVLVLMFSFSGIFVARGLNQQEFKISWRAIIDGYGGLGSNAQFVCIVLAVLPLLSLVFTLAVFLVDGMDVKTAMITVNLTISMALYIVCLVKIRVAVLRTMGCDFLWIDGVKEAVSILPFSFHEYVASFAGAGLVTLVFLSSAEVSPAYYLLVTGIGIIVSGVVEIGFVRCDREKTMGRLRLIWREKAIRRILDKQTGYFQQIRKDLRDKVLAEIDFDGFNESQGDDAVMRRSDNLRRGVNYRCCESGKVKYIVSLGKVRAGETMRRMAEGFLESLSVGDELDEEACEHIDDEEIEKLYHSFSTSQGRIHANVQEVSSARSRLEAALHEISVPAVVRLSTAVIGRNGMRNILIDVPETGDVRIRDDEREFVVQYGNVAKYIESLFQ